MGLTSVMFASAAVAGASFAAMSGLLGPPGAFAADLAAILLAISSAVTFLSASAMDS